MLDFSFSFLLQASFSVSENRTDIDIADPNFWQKWAKKADLDVDEFGGKVRSVRESDAMANVSCLVLKHFGRNSRFVLQE